MLTRINDILAFVIEIASLVLVTNWAFSIPVHRWQKFLLAGVALLVFVVVWALFFAPTARYPLKGPMRWILEFIVLFFPFLRFHRGRMWFSVLAGVFIAVNLIIQSNMGRADW